MLTIAVSSRSLFHMEEANHIHGSQGQAAFDDYMLRTENDILPPGAAFPLVKKLLALNSAKLQRDRVEVVLLSRNSGNAGMRVMNSVHAHGLDIEQAVFTNGADRFRYADAMGADLFLCAEEDDARRALREGMAAASIIPSEYRPDDEDLVVRIGFDGDSVLFSDEADQLYREHGLERFREDELRNAAVPLGDGPFKRFFGKLCAVRNSLPPEKAGHMRLGLVTARAVPNHGRPIATLRSWGLTVDEVIFAAGKPKGPFVRAFRADAFFDDTGRHVQSCQEHGVPSGLVPMNGAGGLGAAARGG